MIPMSYSIGCAIVLIYLRDFINSALVSGAWDSSGTKRAARFPRHGRISRGGTELALERVSSMTQLARFATDPEGGMRSMHEKATTRLGLRPIAVASLALALLCSTGVQAAVQYLNDGAKQN